jgi:glutaminyl-tRNA synthetase
MSVEPSDSSASAAAPAAPTDFIRDIVASDVAAQRYPQIVTRFPPEPNGYLHIGHAKSICLNFGIARENAGRCNLRFDDTNPVKEDVEYVDSITHDVRWLVAGWADHCLGFKPKGAHPKAGDVGGKTDFHLAAVPVGAPDAEPFFASDYFEQLYGYAVELIKRGQAYVDDLTPEETDAYRGAPDKPGKDSPWRTRAIAENLDLFTRMRAGEFPNGARSLRAKIDMASPNIWLRDPLLYRIRHVPHHHAGDKWCIYPLYDFAHCLSDYLEGITHSVCTLEFEVHRPLYDWVLQSLELPRALPHQYEFAKLILSYTIFSKRRLLQLVEGKFVDGWDDARMPTLSGARRRGIPASAIRRLCAMVGVTKYDSVTDIAVFEHAIREELNAIAQRRLAVLRPIKLVLTNIAAGETIECLATNNPQSETPTTRSIALTREVFIESEDFAEVPPPKYFRLKPGGEVRLKYACIIKLDEMVHHQTRRDREGRHGRHHRAALHRRSHDAFRSAQLRSQSQRHDSLGQRHAVRRRRGAALRPPLHRGRAGRNGGFHEASQSALTRCRDRKAGTVARPCDGRRPLSIRARRLFRHRQERHVPRQNRVQPHDLVEVYVGEKIDPTRG